MCLFCFVVFLFVLVIVVCVAKAHCSPSPCKNGGTCTVVGDHYECACPMGFMGKTCDGVLTCCFSSKNSKIYRPSNHPHYVISGKLIAVLLNLKCPNERLFCVLLISSNSKLSQSWSVRVRDNLKSIHCLLFQRPTTAFPTLAKIPETAIRPAVATLAHASRGSKDLTVKVLVFVTCLVTWVLFIFSPIVFFSQLVPQS